jgi:hypothetical protein
VKLLDFGVSKWRADALEGDLTRTGSVLGSPRYMSPEQIFATQEVDYRADIWSLGAIGYELVGGRSPFDETSLTRLCALLASGRPPPSLRELRPDVPHALDVALLRCLRHTPTERPDNVGELAGDLLAAIGSPLAESVRARIAATLQARSTTKEARPKVPAPAGSLGGMATSGSFDILDTNASSRRRLDAKPEASQRRRMEKVGGVLGVAIVALVLCVRAGYGLAPRSADERAVGAPAPANAALPGDPPVAVAEPIEAPSSVPSPGVSTPPLPSSSSTASAPARLRGTASPTSASKPASAALVSRPVEAPVASVPPPSPPPEPERPKAKPRDPLDDRH